MASPASEASCSLRMAELESSLSEMPASLLDLRWSGRAAMRGPTTTPEPPKMEAKRVDVCLLDLEAPVSGSKDGEVFCSGDSMMKIAENDRVRKEGCFYVFRGMSIYRQRQVD